MTMPLASRAPRPWPLAAILAGLALTATVWSLSRMLPLSDWRTLLSATDITDMRFLIATQSFLPRVAASLLCGAALALAGAIFQQVLRNPLAAPTTLGIAAGAKLALGLATLWGAPALLSLGRDGVAMIGGVIAMAATMALAWRRGLSPLAVVLAGMILGLYCGALSVILLLFKEHYLTGLFIWGSGSLSQQGWDVVQGLGWRIAVLAVCAGLLLRPLTLLTLDDAGARSLGLSLQLMRVAALAVAVGLTAVVVSLVGVIGFIGLVAPAVARFAGARRLGAQLFWAPLFGAALLWLTDQSVQIFGGPAGSLLPTGTVTALFGAPMILWLMRQRIAASFGAAEARAERRIRRSGLLLGALALGLAAILTLALTLGRGPDGGWSFAVGTAFADLSPWRVPRTLASLCAGAMLGAAGTILQRLMRNPMASPEVLGISAGASFGLLAVLFLTSVASRDLQILGATLGAGAVLVAMLLLGRSSSFSPERMLLTGIALGALLDALVGALAASGDPRAMLLMTWMTGSTYGVDWTQMFWAAGAAAVLLGLAPLALRWLDLIALGDAASVALGLRLSLVRLLLLLLTAGLTAAGTLVVGPLTFVGLMTPHLARLLGLQRAAPQLAGAVLLGALVMVSADWLGRIVAFPWQMPAGLIATLIGGPVLMTLLARR